MLMKRLRFAFITTVQYSQPVHGHQLVLRCVPLNDAGQLLETYTVKIMPGRLPAPQKDGFGNTVFWCSIGSEHNVLRYGSRGIARVDFLKYAAMILMESLEGEQGVIVKKAHTLTIECNVDGFPAELDGDVVTATPLLIEMYSQTVNFLA